MLQELTSVFLVPTILHHFNYSFCTAIIQLGGGGGGGHIMARLYHGTSQKILRIVHRKHSAFMVPHSKDESKFVSELERLFNAFADASALKFVVTKAASVMQILLQKPSKSSKIEDKKRCSLSPGQERIRNSTAAV